MSAAGSAQQKPTGFAADLVVLLAIGLIVRGLLSRYYSPQLGGDTATYVILAQHLRNLDLLTYNGERTPSYPLLLLIAGLDEEVIWLLQGLLGIGVSLLCYFVVLCATASRRAALVAGVIHSASLNQLFYEAILHTETLATFLVCLSVAVFARFVRRSADLRELGVLGVIGAFAALTRPVYLVLGPVFFALIPAAKGIRPSFRLLLVFTLTFLLPVVIWASINRAATGVFAVTTLQGYSLSNHSGGFIELAPEKYAKLRDIYLRYRAVDRLQSPSRTHSNTAIHARQELMRELGLNNTQLSQELTTLSVELFRAYPTLYATSVFEAWVSFWAAPIEWNTDAITSPSIKGFLALIWRVEQVIIRLANLGFVVISATAVVLIGIRWRRITPDDVLILALIGVVLGTSILQALVEFGSNPRFGIPTQPLVMCFMVIMAARTKAWLALRGRML